MKTLSECPLFLAGDEIEIWYASRNSFPDTVCGVLKIDPANPSKTHHLLGSIGGFSKNERNSADTEVMLNRLYRYLQGEEWSPNGEARSFVKEIGHTSMCVGDAIRFKSDPNTWHVVASIGWETVKTSN